VQTVSSRSIESFVIPDGREAVDRESGTDQIGRIRIKPIPSSILLARASGDATFRSGQQEDDSMVVSVLSNKCSPFFRFSQFRRFRPGSRRVQGQNLRQLVQFAVTVGGDDGRQRTP
jgi:hypothetical protein